MSSKKKKHPLQHLLAGGTAGLVESSICHPLDTIKTRMQLRRQATSAAKTISSTRSLTTPHKIHLSQKSTQLPNTVTAPLGPIGTAQRIVRREGFISLYKGLSAVYTGIVPKMAIRFVSFESYREHLAEWNGGNITNGVTLVAGLMSGLTEAILIVTPAEVCKIRMQAQYHSLVDPSQKMRRKYTNVLQTATTIVKEEGLSAMYKGVAPTMIRQGVNQAVNFTAYQWGKKKWKEYSGEELKSWQHLLLGGLSGGLGPMANNPLDVVKTRIQRQVIVPGHDPKYKGLIQSCVMIAREEGLRSLWKGLTPRLMRIMPGQAITFMTYEAVSGWMNNMGWFHID